MKAPAAGRAAFMLEPTYSIAYLLLAHQSPQQVLRLVNRLDGDGVYFFLHIDAKVDQQPFEQLFQNRSNVNFIEARENCIWGDYSITRATFKLAEAAGNALPHGVAVLLSGQDYPLYNAVEVRQYFEHHEQLLFIDCLPISENWKGQQLKVRTRYYRYTTGDGRNDYLTLGPNMRAISKWLRGQIPTSFLKLLFKKRHSPVPLYGGSNWWALPLSVLREMGAFYDAHQKRLDAYFEYTHCSDEIFFQSLLMAILPLTDGYAIVPSVQYANWERKNVPLPVTFELQDLQWLQQLPASKLFARKFDMLQSAALLDALDARIAADRPA